MKEFKSTVSNLHQIKEKETVAADDGSEEETPFVESGEAGADYDLFTPSGDVFVINCHNFTEFLPMRHGTVLGPVIKVTPSIKAEDKEKSAKEDVVWKVKKKHQHASSR